MFYIFIFKFLLILKAVTSSKYENFKRLKIEDKIALKFKIKFYAYLSNVEDILKMIKN